MKAGGVYFNKYLSLNLRFEHTPDLNEAHPARICSTVYS